MSRARLVTGARGEELVARHLAATGCRVLARNWRCPYGEIDLVALERGEVVFIEVKSRRGDGFGLPEESVTMTKRRKLRLCALAWLAANGASEARWRIDVFAVSFGAGVPRAARFRAAVGEGG